MTSKHSQAPHLISKGVFDSIKSFKDFEQRVSLLFESNTKEQGDAFEIFVEAYLLTQPITQCAVTWLVGNIPVEVRDELNLPNDSKGIDGVFKSINDVLVPYQVKFRSNRPALGFNEVAPFLGITEKAVGRFSLRSSCCAFHSSLSCCRCCVVSSTFISRASISLPASKSRNRSSYFSYF